ncbi:MAG: sialidase family protein [Candidatus Methanomethyliaceae archaeon]
MQISSRLLRQGCFVIAFLLVLSAVWQDHTASFSQLSWTQPYPLIENCCNAFPIVVPDLWGQVHIFWSGTDRNNPEDLNHGFVFYARYGDNGWSQPIEILASDDLQRPRNLEATVDRKGNLHLVWTNGPAGDLLYSRASAFALPSAQSWSPPQKVADEIYAADITADHQGTLHLVYSQFGPAGIFYSSSTDQGESWSPPRSVFARLREDESGGAVRVAVDASGKIHVVWELLGYPAGSPGLTIGYSFSNDGGNTWTAPFEPYPRQDETRLVRGAGGPSLALSPSGEVHLTWFKGAETRKHQISRDGGITWSEPENAFPESLSGRLGGPIDMAFDSEGTLHVVTVVGTLGVWYRSWQQESGWSEPLPLDDRPLDWHHGRIAVSQGNQLWVVYADILDTGRIWVTTTRVEAPSVPPLPKPASTNVPTKSAGVLPPTVLSPSRTVPATKAVSPDPRVETPIRDPLFPLLLGFFCALAVAATGILMKQVYRRRLK